MLVKTEAIVLRSLKYGDNKLIVDLFTRSAGRMSVIAPLSKSGKSKIKKQLLQPLSIIEISVDVRPKLIISKLVDVKIAYPFASIPFDPIKLSMALFIADFLCQALRSEQNDENLFAYILRGVEWFDSCSDGFANFHLVFMMRLSLFLGFFPNLDDYVKGSLFDMRGACFIQQVPLHRDFLDSRESELLLLMMRMNFSNMHLFRMSRTERNRLIDVILHYYRLHLPEFHDLKSLAVLRELF